MSGCRLLPLPIVAACSAASLPAVRLPSDPLLQEIHLVGFSTHGETHLVLDRRGGPQPDLQVWEIDPTERRQTPVALDLNRLATLTAGTPMTTAEFLTLLGRNPLAGELARLGFSPPSLLGEPPVETPWGELTRCGHELRLGDGDEEVTVAVLAEAPLTSESLWLSADGRRAAWTGSYAGRPTVTDLRVIPLLPAAARLLSIRAFAAHQAQAFDTAAAFWLDAWRLNPTADVAYNLACAHAGAGRTELALDWLSPALSLGGAPFRTLAERDADLDPLRNVPRFIALLREAAGRERQPNNPAPDCAWHLPLSSCR